MLSLTVGLSLLAQDDALPVKVPSQLPDTVGCHSVHLWQTLRPYASYLAEADSIDTLGIHYRYKALLVDSSRRVPVFAPGGGAYPRINTALFMVNYRPDQKPRFGYRSQYTPEARRDAWRDSTRTLGVKANFADPTGLTPIDRAKFNYIKQHPEAVHYSWQEIPAPWEDMYNGKRMRNRHQEAALAEIFKPDDRLTQIELRKKEQPPEGPWKLGGEENLQLSQLAVVNWTKGGENSVSFLHDFRFNALYKHERSEWQTDLVNKIGLTFTSALGARISTDNFDLSTKYGFVTNRKRLKLPGKWLYSSLISLKTQLFRNYGGAEKKDGPKSTCFSPAYLKLTFGMDYKRENLSVLLSPYTASMTLVADTAIIDQTKYGIDEDKKVDFMSGFAVNVDWKHTFIYGIVYATKLELFYEYEGKNGTKQFDWENVFDVQINRFLSTRLLLELRYFDNEIDKFQFKENFSISFKYVI